MAVLPAVFHSLALSGREVLASMNKKSTSSNAPESVPSLGTGSDSTTNLTNKDWEEEQRMKDAEEWENRTPRGEYNVILTEKEVEVALDAIQWALDGPYDCDDDENYGEMIKKREELEAKLLASLSPDSRYESPV
jgi:hypothetical protein